jgi:hypothetical protein
MDLSPGMETVPVRRPARLIVLVVVELTELFPFLEFNSRQDLTCGLLDTLTLPIQQNLKVSLAQRTGPSVKGSKIHIALHTGWFSKTQIHE